MLRAHLSLVLMCEDFQPLKRDFYSKGADVVSRALLGKWLLRRLDAGQFCGGIIVETEAYLANDPASHAFKGRTIRNAAMFGPPGHAYVYLIYGCHYCVNAVCMPSGVGEAVLIRAVHPLLGLEEMRCRRGKHSDAALTNGPGKLCMAMQIDRTLDGADLCNEGSSVIIAESKKRQNPYIGLSIASSARIGISRATDLPLRFYFPESGYISRK